ncbi:unnamed protein product, partial [Symbiodinium pilosum]
MGVIHCDVNPWNILCQEEIQESGADVDLPLKEFTFGHQRDERSYPQAEACLVDWACSAPSEGGSAPKLSRRGDFQAAELVQGRVGPQSDVFGCASTLLWLLLKRTRKGLPDRTPELVKAQLQQAAGEELSTTCLEKLASAITWGMEESWE